MGAERTMREVLKPVIDWLYFIGQCHAAKMIDKLLTLAEKENVKYLSQFYKE